MSYPPPPPPHPTPHPSPSAPRPDFAVNQVMNFDSIYQQEESDAALARMLQAQEEEEAQLRAQAAATVRTRTEADFLNEVNHAVNANTNINTNTYANHANANVNMVTATATATRVYIPDSPQQPPQPQGAHGFPYPYGPANPPPPPPPVPPVDMSNMSRDERMAWNIEQEMRDQQLARMMQLKEDEALAMRSRERGQRGGNLRQTAPVNGVHANGNGRGSGSADPPRRCGTQRVCSASVMFLILGGGACLVLFFGSSIWQRLGGDANDLPPFFNDNWGTNNKPANGTAGEFSEWRNKKKGLKLEVRNALSPDWDGYFDEAIKDWDEAPALSLSTSYVEADPDCSNVDGIMKVCNDEYGRTGWTGLNEVYFQGSYIAASVAKMNESYLGSSGTSNAEKLFVMCHEIGHGFGLPHRDEIANNADLGSCLDYTYRFENNKRPDTVVDFENLKLLYGTVDGTPNNRIRHLRGDASTSTGTRINAQQHESSAEITQSRKWHYKEGRLLHESKHKRIYENHLGGGRRVVTTLLLAKDDQQD